MQTKPTSEPIGSPLPGAMREPIRWRNRASSVLAIRASALRGDKYLVSACPPDGHGAEPAPGAEETKGRRVMRERHLPRVCGPCQAPMARQENTCWRCGTEWASEDEPRTRLRLIPGDAHRQVEDAQHWTNERGGFAPEATAPLRAAAAKG